MRNQIVLVKTKFGKHHVASKAIADLSAASACNLMTNSLPVTIFIKDNLIGLNQQVIENIIAKKSVSQALVIIVDDDPCVLVIDNNLIASISDHETTIFDKIEPSWQKFETKEPRLQILNSIGKIVSFEEEVQKNLKQKAIQSGTFLQNPNTVQLSYDTIFGKDVFVEANVYFSHNVIVGDNVRIKAFCHLEDVDIQNNAVVGPFARIRGGSVIGENVKIGNFVEVKKSILGKSTKAAHLTYIGDAEIGENVNFGAGSVICNYDGVYKHKTVIKDQTFIGSNTTIIAPITIGRESFVAAASCINKDVDDKTFSISRSVQVNKHNLKIKK
jgi:acetyltransferase-like isoleucine patch superfamily enzyme